MYVQTISPLVRNFDPEGVDLRLPLFEFASPLGTQDVQYDVQVCVFSDYFPLVRNFDLEGVDQGLPFATQDGQNDVLGCICSDHFPFS